MTPKVSIIVPVYNVERYLDNCLKSLVNQSLSDVEIIVVNDGSTDGSLSIAHKYSEQFGQIAIIDKNNEGLGEARNSGLKYARGKYVTFVDSDDALSPHACEVLYNTAEEYHCEIVAGKSVWFRSEGDMEPVEYYEHWFRKDLTQNFRSDPMFAAGYVAATGKLYLTSMLKENNIKFPKLIGEDVPFSVMSFYYASNIKIIPDIVYLRTERQEFNNKSITQQYNAKNITDRIEGLRIIDNFCNEKSWQEFLRYKVSMIEAMSKMLMLIMDVNEFEKAYCSLKEYILQLDDNLYHEVIKKLRMDPVEFKSMGADEFLFRQQQRFIYIPRDEWKKVNRWNAELLQAKQWYKNQISNYQKEVLNQRKMIEELTDWVKQLEEAKKWLLEQIK